MLGQKRLRDYGIKIGIMPTGKLNAITDIAGITVGHTTLTENGARTGVTVIIPHQGNIFKEKVMAASYVINGFGKTIGTIQIDELGTIETPIALTNTLSAGTAATALIKKALAENPDIGDTTGTVNPVVGECNDSYLNNIRNLHVSEEHVFQAIENATKEFEEGGVGAGTGMSCYGLKGGIGSASRVIEVENIKYTLGALVLANFGTLPDLVVNGIKAGRIIEEQENQKEMGSIIVVLATDLPLVERQLRRLAKRAQVGIARTGSFVSNGSGDIVIAFTTANKVKHYPDTPFIQISSLHDEYINPAFRAVVESVEEAILNALITADPCTGRNEHKRKALKQYINHLIK